MAKELSDLIYLVGTAYTVVMQMLLTNDGGVQIFVH